MIRKAAILAGLLAAAAPASASVDVPAKAVWSLTDIDSLQFCAKCNPDDVASTTRLENYKRTIADTVQMGARHILVQAVAGAGRATRLGEFAQALSAYNTAAAAADRACMAVLYADYGTTHTDSEITALYTTAWDTSGTYYCSIDGRPVVATLDDRTDQTCAPAKIGNIIARLRTLASGVAPTAVHWIAGFGERSEYADWQSACRDKVTATVPVSYSYLEMANDDPAFAADAATRRDAVKAAGGRYILGLPTASAQNCGAFCGTGADSSAYRHTGFGGFARLLAAWRAGADNVAYTFGPGGPYGKDQFVSTAVRCDANDLVTPATECASVAALDEPLVPGAPVADGTVTEEPPPPTPGTTGSFVIAGPQCTNVTPPAAAAAAGLTKLEFCDDFSTDSIARGTTAADRTMVANKHLWNTESAEFSRNGPNSTMFVHPAGDISFPGNGIMRLTLSTNEYQKAIQSVQIRNGVVKGYYVNKKRAYIETRVRHTALGGNQPAFWTMEICKWFENTLNCRDGHFLEQDILEYGEGQRYWHVWKEVMTKVGTCKKEGLGWPSGTWQVAATRSDPDGVSRIYKDGSEVASFTPSNCSVNASYLHFNVDGQHPLLWGGKPGDVLEMDYTRVWVDPNAPARSDDPVW